MLRRRARHASKNMYAVLTGMAVIIVSVTVFWSLSFAQLFGTFFPHNNVDSTYASSNLRITSYHIKGVLFNLSLALTDLLLIYRLYIVWQDHVAVTVPPLILLCGTIVVAASSADLIKRAVTSPIDAMFYAPFAARAFAGFSLVLLINSYCTAMIAWRIWAVGRRSANSNLSVVSLYRPSAHDLTPNAGKLRHFHRKRRILRRVLDRLIGGLRNTPTLVHCPHGLSCCGRWPCIHAHQCTRSARCSARWFIDASECIGMGGSKSSGQ